MGLHKQTASPFGIVLGCGECHARTGPAHPDTQCLLADTLVVSTATRWQKLIECVISIGQLDVDFSAAHLTCEMAHFCLCWDSGTGATNSLLHVFFAGISHTR